MICRLVLVRGVQLRPLSSQIYLLTRILTNSQTMDACDKPDARLMREKLDFDNMLGLDEEIRPGT